MIAIIVQCALCESRTKGTYLRDKYHKLAGRRGKKKAAIAIGHKILVRAYYMLRDGDSYKEIGMNYLDNRNKERVSKYYMNKLLQLGYEVLLVEKESA